MTEPMSPPGKIVIKETVQASAKGRNAEADALTLKINQTITQTRSNQYSKDDRLKYLGKNYGLP